jgi:vacuolar protein sorting-associated protein 35
MCLNIANVTFSADLHHPVTIENLRALLFSPIEVYSSVLTLLALPSYNDLLLLQPYSTRRSVAHDVVASVLRNETLIETPEDVKGILDLCHVLVKDQRDAAVGMPMHPGMGRQHSGLAGSNRGQQGYDLEDMAEEQGWLARMVHLFRSEDLQQQFKVSENPSKHSGVNTDVL